MNNKKHKMTYLKRVTIWVVYYYGYFYKKTVSILYHEEIKDKKHLNILKWRLERDSILYNLLQTQEIRTIQNPYLSYLNPAV
jgi:hypothetical protein